MTYKTTMRACFVGYIVQAIVNNFVPLLFLTFQNSYDISLSKIAMLVSFNFGIQLVVDLLAAGFVDKIGYKTSVCVAHGFAAVGLVLLAFLPEITPDPFVGLVAAITVYAIGGGLIEVIISPMVDACPTDNKEKTMSLLHSFYCWGHVGVVLISTAYFAVFGIENWHILALIWAIIPLLNGIVFLFAPIAPIHEEGESGLGIKQLAANKLFWIFMLLMFAAGACEQAVSQWASTFAEQGLGVSKAVGDLAGPTLFATAMGTARVFYGKYGKKIRLDKFMLLSGLACAVSYVAISLSPTPFIGFLGCAMCGVSVGILWPGSYSLGSKSIRNGGTAMFALFALSGDLGCAGGPAFVGIISDMAGGNLKKGIASALIFPALLIIGLFVCKKCSLKR